MSEPLIEVEKIDSPENEPTSVSTAFYGQTDVGWRGLACIAKSLTAILGNDGTALLFLGGHVKKGLEQFLFNRVVGARLGRI